MVTTHDYLCTQLKFDTSQIYKELQDISSVLQDLLEGSLDYNEAICGNNSYSIIIEILY